MRYVRFSHNLFLVPYLRVKPHYRGMDNTFYDSSAPRDKNMLMMVYQYTQAEYN